MLTVLEQICQKVQYLGSWLTFKGMFIPRSFEDVEKSRFGDCKDFATGTVAMLRALGIEADIALVERSLIAVQYDPFPSWFVNHAIVKATTSTGKVYWIDPTNYTATLSVRGDIADRPAITMKDRKAGTCCIEHIPSVPFSNKTTTMLIDTTDLSRMKVKQIVNYDEYHPTSSEFSCVHLFMAVKEFEDYIYQHYSTSPIPEKDRIKTDIPELKSRRVIPICYSLEYYSHDLFPTNRGSALMVSFDTLVFYLGIKNVKEDDVCDLFLSEPKEHSLRYIIQGKHLVNPESMNKVLKTQWFEYEMKGFHEKEDTVFELRIKLLQTFIPNDVLKTQEFLDARAKIKSLFQDQFIILETLPRWKSFLVRMKNDVSH